MQCSRPDLVALSRRFAHCRRGVAAIEMAFIAPVLTFLAAGMIDFGLGFYVKMMVEDAVSSGGTYAVLNAATYGQAPCSSNTGCAFDQSVVAAATISHSLATYFSTPVTATAAILSCCVKQTLSGSSTSYTVDLANCSQPPSAAPTCASGQPAAGTYMRVSANSSYATLLPYSFVDNLFNLGLNIPNPVPLTAYTVVRIQ
jgi:Flp pilus assembly protein TadG